MIDITDEFAAALEVVASGRHLFVIGGRFTGKHTFAAHLQQTLAGNVLCVAPTAISAYQHSTYCLDQLVTFSPTGGKAELGAFADIVPHLDVLIIEDAQLLRADRFDQLQTALQHAGKHPGEHFGGVQIVLIGDLLAGVPDVDFTDVDQLQASYRGPQVCYAKAYRAAEFTAVAFTRPFVTFDNQVTRVRRALGHGHFTHHALAMCNRHVQTQTRAPLGIASVDIMPTRAAAQKHAEQQLYWMGEVERMVTARRVGQTEHYCPPVPEELRFAAGLSVMAIRGDAKRRYFARANGIVIDIDFEVTAKPHYRPVVTVEFQRGEPVEVRDHCFVVHRPRIGEHGIEHDEVGRYYQLPLVFAEGISIADARGIGSAHLFFHREGAPEYPGQLTAMLTDYADFDDVIFPRRITWQEARAEGEIGALITCLTTNRTEAMCAIEFEVATVGDRRFPLELALAFPDGYTITSLIAPPADVELPESICGVPATRLQLAPTFAQVWAMVEQEASGACLVAADGDATLQTISEAGGDISSLPEVIASTGTSLAARRAGSGERGAGARARASLAAAYQGDVSGAVYRIAHHRRSGYALTREGMIMPYGAPELVTELLSERIRGQTPTDETDRSLLDFEQTYHQGVPRRLMVDFPPLDQVLRPGVKVCFYRPDFEVPEGMFLSHLARIASEHGLEPVTGKPEPYSEILFAGNASRALREAKAKHRWRKPVYSVREFLQWVQAVDEQPVHRLQPATQVEPTGAGEEDSADAAVIALPPRKDDRPPIGKILRPGTIIFIEWHDAPAPAATGALVDEIMAERELAYSRGGFKTECRALITTDPSADSVTISLARRVGLPIYSLAEFFTWAHRKLPQA